MTEPPPAATRTPARERAGGPSCAPAGPPPCLTRRPKFYVARRRAEGSPHRPLPGPARAHASHHITPSCIGTTQAVPSASQRTPPMPPLKPVPPLQGPQPNYERTASATSTSRGRRWPFASLRPCAPASRACLRPSCVRAARLSSGPGGPRAATRARQPRRGRERREAHRPPHLACAPSWHAGPPWAASPPRGRIWAK